GGGGGSTDQIAGHGRALYGLWRSQIGLPRDTITAVTVWRDTEVADRMADLLHDETADTDMVELDLIPPTLPPKSFDPPRRQGNYAFQRFEIPAENYASFLNLSEAA
ncbi:MAG: hypothetical protein CFH10_01535, partial [Alphaproteobacteria bacterium MarineAlpha4_Bin2]